MALKTSRALSLVLSGIIAAGLFGFRYDRVDKVRVKDVESGDTFIVMWQGKLIKAHLIGIDAPDKDEPLFEEAKKALSELIKDKLVQLKFDNKDSRPQFDQVGRWICIAYIDGKCINEEMVKKGLARVDKRNPCSKLKDVESIENKARVQKLGIWGAARPDDQEEPKIEVYVGWKHDKIYHRAGCRILDKYRSEEIIIFSNKDEAREGREPCPACIEKPKPSP